MTAHNLLMCFLFSSALCITTESTRNCVTTSSPPLATTERVLPANATTTSAFQDRFLASILAGAVGDALGEPVEFMKIEKIRKKFGPNGTTGYEGGVEERGLITDDTQMT